MRILCVALLSLVSTSVFAESAFRAGIGVIRANLQEDDIGFDGSSTGWELFAGWELNRYFAVEVGYLDGAKPKDEISGIVAEIDTSALQASVLGSLWVNDSFNVFGRAGVMNWKADTEIRSSGTVLATASDDGTDPFFGVGASLFVENALMRIEYRVADLDGVDFTGLDLNIAWRF